MEITTIPVGEDSDCQWDKYVLNHPDATGYHQLAWCRVIQESFGHRPVCLMARDEEGKVRGLLPLVFMSSRLFGSFLVSIPFVNYGGLLADEATAGTSLLEMAMEVARDYGVKHIELRHQRELSSGWLTRQHKVSMRLALPSDFQKLWDQFPAKLRSQIRRAQKEGMTVQVGGDELLNDFYKVFSRNMRDLGTPVYSRGFFKNILKRFSKDARICAVYFKGSPVAAGFLYGFRQFLEIPWASSDRRFNRLAPNMLLYNSALEYACQRGFQVFDFGRSSPGSGPCRFKEQWGAQPVPLYWAYWLNGKETLPELNPHNPKYRLAIQLWKTLPLALTNFIGPAIVRNLP
ncbi:MAG: FemAB family XrtA/PEP-CTERM system-associated protein [Nitrospiria bacterium]